MLQRWARTVYRRRWWVLAVAVVVATLAGTASTSIGPQLDQGGFEVESSEAYDASAQADDALNGQDADAILVYTSDQGPLAQPGPTQAVREVISDLPDDAVSSAVGWWEQPTMLSEDTSLGVVTLDLRGDDQSAAIEAWQEIEDRFTDEPAGSAHGVDGLSVGVSGESPIGSALSEQAEADLIQAEMVSFPVLLVLLIIIFGGVVAAGIPLMIGAVGVVSSLGVLRILVEFTEVSVFALNMVTLLGLGLAIDYGLFIVSRFREELHRREDRAPGDVADALSVTLATAGRTVLVSGSIVFVALSSLLVFPLDVLTSIGFGGMAAVAVAALSAVTVLPALLALIGYRLDALPVLRRRAPTTLGGDPSQGGWGRLGRRVMRRPTVVAVVVVGVMLVLGSPFLRAEFGQTDTSVLPADDPVRVATERLTDEMPTFSGDSVSVVMVGSAGPASEAAVEQLTAAARAVPDVGEVVPAGADGDVVVLNAELEVDSQSSEAKDAVRELRAMTVPDGVDEVLVGGFTATIIDSTEAIGDQLPVMAVVLVGAVVVLLFLAFGSVLVPLKAALLSALSLTASFGVVVWIFQEGNLVDLFGTEAGPIDPILPVLMLAVLFGLGTDYEVFLLSRVVEAYRAGYTPKDAVIYGLARTGPIITAAALLLMVVIGAFALSGLAFMKFIGIGMLVSIAVDATVVRGLLVPAALALLGRAAWWAPAPLARLQRQFALEPHDTDVEAPGSPRA